MKIDKWLQVFKIKITIKPYFIYFFIDPLKKQGLFYKIIIFSFYTLNFMGLLLIILYLLLR
jgi:hypothetical protein